MPSKNNIFNITLEADLKTLCTSLVLHVKFLFEFILVLDYSTPTRHQRAQYMYMCTLQPQKNKSNMSLLKCLGNLSETLSMMSLGPSPAILKISLIKSLFILYYYQLLAISYPFFFLVTLCIYVGLEQFIGRGCFFPTIIMFMEYGLAVASSTYCLSFLFSDHTIAQVSHFFILILYYVFQGIQVTL